VSPALGCAENVAVLFPLDPTAFVCDWTYVCALALTKKKKKHRKTAIATGFHPIRHMKCLQGLVKPVTNRVNTELVQDLLR
jgi:hypothetical protein